MANAVIMPKAGITVESWILDYSGDLYGRSITLEFYKFLRSEQKFPDLASLQTEIRRNAAQTRELVQREFTQSGLFCDEK